MPKGGLFDWGEDKTKQIDTDETARLALEKNVAIAPGAMFYPPRYRNNHGMRLNFSNQTEEKIWDGVEILADIVKEQLVKQGEPTLRNFIPANT